MGANKTAYRTAEQEKILKEVTEMDEAAQEELYAALNQTINGKPLAEHDPVILRVTQQTLKERLELENIPVVEEEKSVYSRIKEKMPKIIAYTSLVGLVEFIVLTLPPIRELYSQSYRDRVAEEEKEEEKLKQAKQKLGQTKQRLEQMIDGNCNGELSAGEFLDFYENVIGKEFPNKNMKSTITSARDSYLEIELNEKREPKTMGLTLSWKDHLPSLAVDMDPEKAFELITMGQEKGRGCYLDLK